MGTHDLLRQWTQTTALAVCKNCRDNCCNTQKNKIELYNNDLEIFIERGIPFISIEDIREDCLADLTSSRVPIHGFHYLKEFQNHPLFRYFLQHNILDKKITI
jgi:hypothetical protein